MRCLVGFVAVVALGVSACDGGCTTRGDCDDGSTCTNDYCRNEVCEYELVEQEIEDLGDNVYRVLGPFGIVPCSLDDGGLGYCVDGVCREDFCDDGCSVEVPYFTGGGCKSVHNDPDGTPCEANGVVGVCIFTGEGISVCSEHNPCDGVVCEGDLLCTNDDTSRWVYYCDYGDGGVCKQKAESCSDDNECTYDRCDPETGDCFNPPVPDGAYCCLAWERYCPGSFCFSAGSYSWRCTEAGQCEEGVCID